MRSRLLLVACVGALGAAAVASGGGAGTVLSAQLKAAGAVRGTVTGTLRGSTLAWHVRLTGVPRTVELQPARVTLCAPCARTADGTTHLTPAQLAGLHYVLAVTRGSSWRGSLVVSHAVPTV